jgi:uncharacterized protein YceK
MKSIFLTILVFSFMVGCSSKVEKVKASNNYERTIQGSDKAVKELNRELKNY